MKQYLYEEHSQPRPLVHVDGCSCGTCGKARPIDPRMQMMMPDNPDIGDGMEDPNLDLAYDPLFSSVLGTGVSRRDMLKMAGLSALGGMAGMAACCPRRPSLPTRRNSPSRSTPWSRSATSRLPMRPRSWSRTKWASSRSRVSSRSRRH